MSRRISCRMNCIQSQNERFNPPESWSPSPHLAYHPMRASRSAAQSFLHSLDNSRFGNERRSLPAAGGFFALEDDDTDYLLEDSQVPMDSTLQCVCKCCHEVSYPRRSRSFLGYLPDVDEEIGIPIFRDLHGSSRAPPLDEKFCYTYPSPESTLDFIYSNPSNLGRETSRSVSYVSTNADDDFQRLRLEEESLVNSSLSRCNLGHVRQRDDRRMPCLSTPEKFRCINQESSDVYNSGISFDMMNGFSSLPYEGIQSPGYETQFRNRQGAFVPVRPKPAMSNSPSEVPSSSSVSVYSDETEHTGDHPQLKVGLYKTELCRSWEETGFCRYGGKCQFAHGNDDLRPVPRHPKYKTELCRSFTETGLCSYGKRCRFVHGSSAPMQALPRSSDLQFEKTSSRRLSIFQQLCGASEKLPRHS